MEFVFDNEIKPNIDNFINLECFERDLLKKTKDLNNKNKHYKTIDDGICDLLTNNKGLPEEVVEKYRIGWKSQYQNYHKGYLWYLYTAYMADAGIEIAPWYLYNVILHQIAQVVKDNPEEFKNIFTSSNEKISIQMYTFEFDVGLYTEIIKRLIPEQTTYETFFPTWSKLPEHYTECIQGLFADMVQKYYSALIYGCSCPKVRVRGTQEDWDKLHQTVLDLKNIFNLGNAHSLDKYLDKVLLCLENFKLNWNKKETWKDFLFVTNCGSGHQEGIDGTIRQLLNYPTDYELLVDKLPYTISRFTFEMCVEGMEAQKDSCFISGMIGSNLDSDGYLVPSYDYAITWVDHEATQLNEDKTNELLWLRDEIEKWQRISIGGKNLKHHFIHDSKTYSNSQNWKNYLTKPDLEILNKAKTDGEKVINEYLLKQYETSLHRYNLIKEINDPYDPAGEEPTFEKVKSAFEKRKEYGTVEDALKSIEKERLEKLNSEILPYSHLWFEGINFIKPSYYSWDLNKNASLDLAQYLKQVAKVEQYVTQLENPEYLKKLVNGIQKLENGLGLNTDNRFMMDIEIIIGTLNSNIIKLFCELFPEKSKFVLDLLLYYLTNNNIFVSEYFNNVFPSHFIFSLNLKEYLVKRFFTELNTEFKKRIDQYIDINKKLILQYELRCESNHQMDKIKSNEHTLKSKNQIVLSVENEIILLKHHIEKENNKILQLEEIKKKIDSISALENNKIINNLDLNMMC